MESIITAVSDMGWAREAAGLAIVALKSGAFAAIVTQLLKKHPKVPLEEDDRTRIRAVAGVLSAVSVVLLGLASGTIDQLSVQALIEAVITAGAAWGTSHLLYKGVKDAA